MNGPAGRDTQELRFSQARLELEDLHHVGVSSLHTPTSTSRLTLTTHWSTSWE